MPDDEQLLEQYMRDQSEAAFAELVQRHINLVYAVAFRVTSGDRSLAEDITQTVFIDLWRKAWRLPRGVVLAGWLHRHTFYVSATAVRSERRRRVRELTALEMKALDNQTEPAWERIASCLDDSLNRLNAVDRDAVVLRFLKQQDFRAVGTALGISEDAAQKRVSRALEKLRGLLGRRGITLSVAGLAVALTAKTGTAAPAALAASVTAATLAVSTGSGTIFTLLKTMAATKIQTGILSALVIAGMVTPLVIKHRGELTLRVQAEELHQQLDRIQQLQNANEILSRSVDPHVYPTANERLSELLRLRSEIGLLQANVQELAQKGTNEPPSREDMLGALGQFYGDRLLQLKNAFDANPSEKVPELQYLTERDWLPLVMHDGSLDAADGYRLAMGAARSRAQIRFVFGTLADALQQYSKNNDGQFPSELSQLKPYFKSPVDDAVMQNWTIMPANQFHTETPSGEDWVITQKALVNEHTDQRVLVGLKGTLVLGFNRMLTAPVNP